MEVKTAAQLMIPIDIYPRVPSNYTIKQTIKVLNKTVLVSNGKTSLPRSVLVFGENNNLLGYVRRRDMLSALEPKRFFSDKAHHSMQPYSVEIDPNLLEVTYDKLIGAIEEKAESPIVDVMKPIKHFLDYGDHLMKIIFEICELGYSMLPVLKDGNVVGIVRTVEVLDEIVKILKIE